MEYEAKRICELTSTNMCTKKTLLREFLNHSYLNTRLILKRRYGEKNDKIGMVSTTWQDLSLTDGHHVAVQSQSRSVSNIC